MLVKKIPALRLPLIKGLQMLAKLFSGCMPCMREGVFNNVI